MYVSCVPVNLRDDSLGTRRLGGFRNSLLKAKVVKAEDFRIPDTLC